MLWPATVFDVVKARFRRRRLARVVAANLVRCLFRDSARSWGRNFGATAPALGSMTLLLLMAGLVGITGFALHNLEQEQSLQASVLHVYLRDDAADTDIVGLWDQLASDPRIAKVTYMSKDEALARAQSIPGLPELANASESNPFPASLDVQAGVQEGPSAERGIDLHHGVEVVRLRRPDRGEYPRPELQLRERRGGAVAGGQPDQPE